MNELIQLSKEEFKGLLDRSNQLAVIEAQLEILLKEWKREIVTAYAPWFRYKNIDVKLEVIPPLSSIKAMEALETQP